MNTANLTIIVLGGISLALVVAAILLYKAKSFAEQSFKTELDGLQARINESAKIEGQVSELNRTLEAVRNEKLALDQSVQAGQGQIHKLTDDLATARTEAINARTSANELIKHEKESRDAAIEQQRTSSEAMIAQEKESCKAILDAKDHEIEAKNQEILDLKQFIKEAREQLGTDFKSLSQETLKDFSDQFEEAAKKIIEQNSQTTAHNVKLHKEQIENMLQPMGLTLKHLDQQLKDTNEKRGEAEAVLMEKIKDFAGANEKLANALNKPVIRGSFAEVKLESLLEAAGLVRGENFELQVPVKDGDQTRIIDALVDMAQGKKLVIDSKNLLVPFVEYANAPEEEKLARLADFQRAFKTTLKALSFKDYAKHWEGIDAVIMFLPDEGMYMAAIESDRQLIATMFEQRVFTVSPVSLLPILKSVAYILGLEKQNRDTQLIVEAGRALYESLGVILAKVKTLGDRLEGGVEAYNAVIASFEGNVLPKTRTLRTLGIQRGASHKDISVIDPQLRDFKERIVKELDVPDLAIIASGDEE